MISYLISDILFLLRVNPGLPKVSQRGASLSESRRGRWGRTWTRCQSGTLPERSINPFGGVKEGVLRNHIILPDGTIRHSVFYSILDSEWEGVRGRLEEMMREYEEGR